jgi:RNA polymerase sigma factor (sigma-70 family)
MVSGQLLDVLHYLRRITVPAGASPTDAELLNRFVARRDADAFAALVQRHAPMVYGVCQRVLFHVHDAEDAFQATFLILARKAASIRRGQAIAAWLHEVARRVAGQARQTANRRRVHERESLPMPPRQPLDTMDQEELRTILDEELAALPAKYRTALVLCDLEGRTHRQAARELRCPVGSVSWRLSRARALLRDRLTRRGLTLSSAAVAAALTEQASAAIPSSLILVTVRAATTSAAVEANVGTLVQGGLRSLAGSRTPAGLLLLLAACLAGGVGLALAAGDENGCRFAEG